VKEQRKYARVLVRVLVDFESPNAYLYDYSNDLSEGGIFVETESPSPPGTPLTLRFTLPDVDRVFEARGKVAWIHDGQGAIGKSVARGMGVEFVSVEEKDRKLIQEYVGKVAGQLVEKPSSR